MNGRLIIRGTLVAGTLDILSAFVFAGMAGASPARVLRSIAAGPFGDGMRDAGLAGAALGLVVHYSIMAVMVSVFVAAASRHELLIRKPIVSGVIYGLALYLVMYWIVLPARWPAAFPQTGAWQVGNCLFSHLICVGIPMALVTAHALRRERLRYPEAMAATAA